MEDNWASSCPGRALGSLSCSVYSEHVPFRYSPQAVYPLLALGTPVFMQTSELHRNQHLSKAENNTGFEAKLEVILHACKNDLNVLVSLLVYRAN